MKDKNRENGPEKEEISRRELRRSPAFRELLLGEWGVKETPERFDRALSLALEDLPEELPVRGRPLRTAAHWALAATVFFLAVGAALFGLNALEPEIAGSLPGVGSMFRALNGGGEEEPGPVKPSPSSSPASSTPFPTSFPLAGFSQLPTADNGVELLGLNYEDEDPETLTLRVRTPYVGRESYNLFHYFDLRALGRGVELTLPDGTYLEPTNCEDSDGTMSGVEENGEGFVFIEEKPIVRTWQFSGVPREGEVVFTLYEFEMSVPKDFPWEQRNVDTVLNRVLAEFTLDLSSGTAKVSHRYEDRGYRKITPEECLETQRNPGFQNGWYADPRQIEQQIDGEGAERPTCKFVFYGEDLNDEGLSLRIFRDGALLAQADSPEEGVLPEEGVFLDEGVCPHYWNGDVGYSECVTDPARTGRKYRRVVFAFPAEWIVKEAEAQESEELAGIATAALWNDEELLFQLTDASGNVLLEDVPEAYRQEIEEINTRYSGLAVREGWIPTV